ncbi:MAG: hypothetical protein A3J55_02490 [Candidatus Ryanbacteria bacterium RIFCSPHIGHO2_02_FULL_45_17b]|uniref:Methyltransferase type 11 domain-containing protein n=1 Tax=Candidatus Ryanbacteria bacterium RIFCSPHIGHO2_01_FULL_45_22 TaxID=1802114 RepID=A0A1G2G067_9BACT|nr:MAG: hypothetical protein A2719_00930 [Candidatus Ryanbacteria bacterium RIFCSPHIGHO2_01_FULL_45_22]OGZ46795.1 MAG: hypothetical protein A3J55_02490 [Candidatus Ryanbacteria bacterium RIFCSPHIGHO2_02_FULL_45_17b]
MNTPDKTNNHPTPPGQSGTQQFQEEEYVLPYHWLIERATKKGAVYFGYWNIALMYAGNFKEKNVLDAGCGDGFFTSLIATKNPQSVTGVDYSERAISFAQLLAPHAKFYVEQIDKLSFPDKSFDIIFLIEVLEHVPSAGRERIAKELSRILRDNGIIIVSSPSLLMPVIEKHEQHFSEATFCNALAPYFIANQVTGQDGTGYIRTLYLFFFRLAKNRLWTLHPAIQFLTKTFYPHFLNKVPIHHARRFVGIFRKS